MTTSTEHEQQIQALIAELEAALQANREAARQDAPFSDFDAVLQSRAAKWQRAQHALEERAHQQRVALLARQQAEAQRGMLARVKALLGKLFRGHLGQDASK